MSPTLMGGGTLHGLLRGWAIPHIAYWYYGGTSISSLWTVPFMYIKHVEAFICSLYSVSFPFSVLILSELID